ncbi:hypothetical protein HYH02_011853 [Chlamydomonas schloesseri]|uniref:CID domain-containing protein n=1 Tax=Chlamydomonas schloesseri TaxID=2026947 RepID=A0A835T852_9CHLO|nr:hypothetical protein HYH02_011853 [Chlamydomonas schloesseri]|eukprot:KAG2435559.1 hypothetical protein HYH02_011853 [Chlamydomonas schloesseri]
MALSGFGQAFLENLRDLTTPDRRSIVTLRDLAFENLDEAVNVVRAIRTHIKQCSAAHRLPALYLVDCMLKTEPCPPAYAEQISRGLLEIFVFAWDNADASTRPALTKLCKLWRSVLHLDQKVVEACEKYMAPPAGQVAAAAGAPAVGGVLLPPAHAGYPVTQSARPPVAPYGQAPGIVTGSARFPSQLMGQQGQQQQVAIAATSYSTAMPSVRPMYQQPAVPMYPQAAAYGVQQQQPQLVYAQPVGLPATVAGGVPLVIGSYPQPAAHVPVLAANQLRPPSSPQPGPSSPSQQQPTARPRSTEFPGPQALKELDPSAVQELLEASARTRPAFLDAAFLRNKRRATAAGHPSRQWFPAMDMWLQGTTSAPAENATAAGEEEATAEAEKFYFVEEDPSQPECAISGERFERFYDPVLDKWCYKDAVELKGEDADHYGVMDGSLVKVNCLAGEPSKILKANLRAASAAAAAADDLRAASAAPAAAGGSGSGGAAVGSGHLPAAQSPAAAEAAVATQLPQLQQQPSPPAVVMKEELHLNQPLGVVGGVAKRAGDTPTGGAVDVPPEAKRVKLEVL